ncbi:MAG: tRNA pseudouridine(38-40) synthase TruA [Anaerolineales bacterium]|jgi:tRNA pseudouridine38-40 synthase
MVEGRSGVIPSDRPNALYKSILAYDGTEFRGFQRQAAGQRTVQQVVEKALRQLGWEERSLSAAGRTDSGVHARGQVVCFRLQWNHTPDDLTRALNALMPDDVAVWGTETCPEGFHPRFSATRRQYRYTLITVPHRDPLRERFAWRVWPEPNLEAMHEEADSLLGQHDFAAFGRAPKPGGSTVREVYRASWKRQQEVCRFDIVANGFLFRMVRRVVAAMVDVGLGRAKSGEIARCLQSPKRGWEKGLAPASGLCLKSVSYDPTKTGEAAEENAPEV